MSKHVDEPILLVGSIPGETAEEVMRDWGAGLGARLVALPDGEVGDRRAWITFLAYRVFDGNPALETLRRPRPYSPEDPDEWRGPDGDWIALNYEDQWLFKLREGVSTVRFETLGYADAAIDSYRSFKRLRDQGVIAPDLRFQICLPLPESAMRVFLADAADLDALWDAYRDAVRRELAAIFDAIPANRVSIQWDVCVEILAYDPASRALFPWEARGEPFDRFVKAVAELSPHVPEAALLGAHFCYGDLGHKHMVEPEDLHYCVDFANATVDHAGRRIDFVHMPVPRDRKDDAFFKPLADLAIGDTKLYLGLVHTTGGIEDNRGRLATAQRHAQDFGIATECGFGRRPQEQMPGLLEIHRALAEAL